MLTDTVCAAVSAAGLGIACLTAYRRRFLAAARIAAYALVPLGLAMTGLLDWLAALVFRPSVWVGFGVLGLSWVLFMVSGAAGRRAAAARLRDGTPAPGASEPALGPGGKSSGSRAATTPKSKAGGGSGSDDFSDIEAILKKHGI